jgi:hypothetical protein
VANLGVTPGYPLRTDTSIGVECTGATRIEAWGSGGLLEAADADTLTHTPDGSSPYVRLVAWGDYTEPFSGALPQHWSTSAYFSVSGGTLNLSSNSTPRNLYLRRHREGDFEAQVDTLITDGGGAEANLLLFNVLNGTYWYALRLGQSGLGDYNNKLVAMRTSNGGTSQTLIGSAAFTAAMDTWYTVKMDYTAATGTIRAKVWATGGAEPDWMFTAADTMWTWGAFGLRGNYSPSFDNLHIRGFKTYYQPIRVDAS